MITSEQIKQLREKTGVSIMVCKQALEESGGDEKAALEWLKKSGIETAEKKSVRTTKAGIVESYIHGSGKIGVLLEVRSETDFVARNPEFKIMAHDIAMHIAAAVPSGVEELLGQEYIKDPSIKISDYLNKYIQKFGENMEITRFDRFEV